MSNRTTGKGQDVFRMVRPYVTNRWPSSLLVNRASSHAQNARAYRALRDWLVGSTFHGCSSTGAVVECNFDRGAAFHVVYTQDGSTCSAAVPAGMTMSTSLDGATTPITRSITVTGTPLRLF
jgi:hypothetical protein